MVETQMDTHQKLGNVIRQAKIHNTSLLSSSSVSIGQNQLYQQLYQQLAGNEDNTVLQAWCPVTVFKSD